MNEKYQIMTLLLLYNELNLGGYEAILDQNGFEGIIPSELFKYFSLVSTGDVEMFSEEEKAELMFFEKYSIEEILASEELTQKFFDFIKRTHIQYYFSTAIGEYNYYIKQDMEHMVPDDALALCINYRIPIKDGEDYDEKSNRMNKVLSSVINNIQFVEAEKAGIRVAVLKQNELELVAGLDFNKR